MPLLDHFHPPLDDAIDWCSLFMGWATHLADDLNDQRLPTPVLAHEIVEGGPEPEFVGGGPAVRPVLSFAESRPEVIEVRTFNVGRPRKLLGVIALVLPTNKT